MPSCSRYARLSCAASTHKLGVRTTTAATASARAAEVPKLVLDAPSCVPLAHDPPPTYSASEPEPPGATLSGIVKLRKIVPEAVELA